MGHHDHNLTSTKLRLESEPYRANCEARWLKRLNSTQRDRYLKLVTEFRGQPAADELAKRTNEL